jgi:hypothetical protein
MSAQPLFSVEATGTGASGVASLGRGDYVLKFSSAGAFALDVLVGADGDMSDLHYDASTKVSINNSTGPRTVLVPGGLDYGMDVDTFNSAIKMEVYPA